MMERLRFKVTWINNKFHVRLIEDSYLINEMACALKIDISWCTKELLRWYDKLGGGSAMASASRDRHKQDSKPVGKVWYEKELRPKYIGKTV